MVYMAPVIESVKYALILVKPVSLRDQLVQNAWRAIFSRATLALRNVGMGFLRIS
jgi:hypothetical protein